MRVEPLAEGLAWVAMALGLVHARFSANSALGGRWLLRTVGEWAVTLLTPIPSGRVSPSAGSLWSRPRRRSSRCWW